MSEIKDWLDNAGDYYVGIDILTRTVKIDPARLMRLNNPKRQNRDLLTFLLNKCLRDGMVPLPRLKPVVEGGIVLAEDEIIIRKPDKKKISLKSDLLKKTQSVAYVKQMIKEKGEFFKEYLQLHARLSYAEEGEQLAEIDRRIKEIWDKEINPRWKIIDDYELRSIIPEKIKSITLGKLFAELKNIPTKVSRINRLMQKVKEKELLEKYQLQKEVHEKEYGELEEVLNEIAHLPVEVVKELI